MTLKTLNERNPVDSLIIFDRFVLDRDLPKFQEPEDEESEEGLEGGSAQNVKRPWRGNTFRDAAITVNTGPEVFFSTDGNFTVMNTNTINDNGQSVGVRGLKEMKLPRWIRFKCWLYRVWWWVTRKKPEPPPEPKPIPLVFKQVLENEEQLRLFNERDAEFEAMLLRAKQASQKALVEKLEKERNLRRFENMLYAMGRKRFVSEKQLLKFVRDCEKGLCLDWVHQFTRPIPAEVVTEKVACDEAYLFDNYVVLHYDPMNQSAEMTEVEKEEELARRRDPILFGVIRGSRRLYFIGDWKDEQCDLTLQEIIDKLGEPLNMDGEFESQQDYDDDNPPEDTGEERLS